MIIEYALTNGVFVIAAAGNDGQINTDFPAAYPGVIAVCASTGVDSLAGFSNRGPWISIVAPGQDIISTGNGGPSDYLWMSGTSMASPFVTGLSAYLLDLNPSLTPDQIKTIIEISADNLGGDFFDYGWGYGRVNVKTAVNYAMGQNGKTVPASGSRYSPYALKINITDTNSAYNSQISGFPTIVPNEPVYLYAENGQYYTMSITGTDPGYAGTAVFHLLPPGSYSVVANFDNEEKKVKVNITSNADTIADIVFN